MNGAVNQRDGYRAVGATAFGLKAVAFIVGAIVVIAALTWLLGDRVPGHVIWLITAIIWIVRSVRGILNPAREQDVETGEPSVRSIVSWNLATLIFWTIVATANSLYLAGAVQPGWWR